MGEEFKIGSPPNWNDYTDVELPVVSDTLDWIEKHADDGELLGCYIVLISVGISLIPFCLLHLGIRKTLYMRQKRKIEKEQRILRLSDGDILQIIDEGQVISNDKKKNSEI